MYVNYGIIPCVYTTCSLEVLKNLFFCQLQVDELTKEVKRMGVTTPEVYMRLCLILLYIKS